MVHSLLIIFAASVVVSAVLTRGIRNLALARGWVDKPDTGRHIHRTPVPRLGGVAIFTAVAVITGIALAVWGAMGLPSLLPLKTALALVGPAALIFLMGLYDDVRDLPPKAKFSIEILAALWLYFQGFGVRKFGLFFGTNDLRIILGIPLTVLWVLLITNAFNLIDGLDGLSAGSALFSTLTLLVVSLFDHNIFVTLLAVALAGAIIGFLRFNFHPATIFLGDSGSLFIGFLLSALALAGSQKAPTMVSVVLPVICFGFPILDVTLAVARRFLSGRPLFEGDSEHIHHRLLKRGLSQRGVVFLLYGVSGLLALLSLASLRGGQMTGLVLAVITVGICVGIPQLKFHELAELRRVFDRTMRQKRVIENDLHVRRAVDSLRGCEDVSEICKVLVGTLKPIGFDGFCLSVPTWQKLPKALPVVVKQSPNGEMTCSWNRVGSVKANWELRWELVDEKGKVYGSFSVYKQLTDEPLLMDVSLLSNGFHGALTSALRRAADEKLSQEAIPLVQTEPTLAEKPKKLPPNLNAAESESEV